MELTISDFAFALPHPAEAWSSFTDPGGTEGQAPQRECKLPGKSISVQLQTVTRLRLIGQCVSAANAASPQLPAPTR